MKIRTWWKEKLHSLMSNTPSPAATDNYGTMADWQAWSKSFLQVFPPEAIKGGGGL